MRQDELNVNDGGLQIIEGQWEGTLDASSLAPSLTSFAGGISPSKTRRRRSGFAASLRLKMSDRYFAL